MPGLHNYYHPALDGMPKINRLLHVQPVFGTGAQQHFKAQGHITRQGPVLVQHLRQCDAGHAHQLCHAALNHRNVHGML